MKIFFLDPFVAFCYTLFSQKAAKETKMLMRIYPLLNSVT